MKNVFFKSLISLFFLTSVFVSCTEESEDNPTPTNLKVSDSIGDSNTINSYLTFEKKYNGVILQPVVKLVGDLAEDFEALNAGYWESGNRFKTVNGVVSLKYKGNNTVLNTVVNVRLKDVSGKTLAYKVPLVQSASEASFLLSGGSTFLRNTSPLIFQYLDTIRLGPGSSLTTTVVTPNNSSYAQGLDGKNILKLIQVLSAEGASNPDFTGSFQDIAEIEISYFRQTEDINNRNAYVNQKYFNNDADEIHSPLGNFVASQATYNPTDELWEFAVTNMTGLSNDEVSYHFVLQDADNTSVALDLETSISFEGNEEKTFKIEKSSLNRSLTFIKATELTKLRPTILLEW